MSVCKIPWMLNSERTIQCSSKVCLIKKEYARENTAQTSPIRSTSLRVSLSRFKWSLRGRDVVSMWRHSQTTSYHYVSRKLKAEHYQVILYHCDTLIVITRYISLFRPVYSRTTYEFRSAISFVKMALKLCKLRFCKCYLRNSYLR